MTATTRASLSLLAGTAFVAALVAGAAAWTPARSGDHPRFMQGGPQQGAQPGPGGRVGRGRGGPGGPMGAVGPLGPIMRQLNLTDAQRDQVRAIVESHRDDVQALAERVRPAREALEAALSSGTLDEGTIRARSAEVAGVEADMAVAQARIFSEVFQVLTPEQQAQVKTLQTQMRERRGERGRGPRPPAPPR